MKALMFGWEFDTRHGNAARYGYYFLYTEALGR